MAYIYEVVKLLKEELFAGLDAEGFEVDEK